MRLAIPSAPSTEQAPAQVVRVVPSTSSFARVGMLAASALGVFLVALVARAGSVATYVTADEGNWVERTTLFAGAIARGDASGTFLTGHPGVMTMWAGLIGMGFQRTAYLAQNLAAGYIAADQPAYLDALVHGRVILMVVTCVASAAIMLLAWRLFGGVVGLFAGLLLALEPFWIAHALVLHLDASLTSYITISMLAALVYWVRGGHPGYLVLSAATAAMALLAKTPGVFIFLFVPFVAGLTLLADPRRRLSPIGWLRQVASVVVWAAIALVVMLAIWPALRVDPIGTALKTLSFTEVTGGSDHENFFLNDSTGAPGALYYPVTLLLRLSPVTLLGVGLAVIATVAWAARRRWERVGLPVLFVAYCVLFVAMMDLSPKKFDRYLLPLYPVLVILAAIGWVSTVRWLRGKTHSPFVLALLPVLLLAQLWESAGTRPYYMAFYSPILGGATAARGLIVVGWGEGMDQVANQLDSLPNADSITVSTFYNSVFAAQFRGNILSPNAYQPVSADYVLLYVNVSQRSIADRLRAAIRQRDPYMTVSINGLDYVSVYKIDDEDVGTAVPAEFGDTLRLTRYRVSNAASQPGTYVSALLRWKLIGPPRESLTTNLDLVRTDGWVAYRAAVPVGGATPLAQWRPGQETVLSYNLPVPTDLPRGRYRLIASVSDPATGSPLVVSEPPAARAPSPSTYQDGIVLATVQRD